MRFLRQMQEEYPPAIQAPYGNESFRQMMPAQQAMPALPSGIPTGPSPTPLPSPMMAAPPGEQAPTTVVSPLYTPGFLRTQIGRMMRVEFLIGSNGPLVDRIGTLLAVGVSYILLRPVGANDTIMCDIYSIKFVTIYYDSEPHV